MSLRDSLKFLQEKALEWLLIALGPTVIAVYLLLEEQLVTIAKTYPLLWIIRLLVLLLVLCLALIAWLYRKRTIFTEYRGAFFKRKKGGGYHEAVYCGACKLPTAIANKIPFQDEPFVCKCGWRSSFNLGDFNNFFPTIKP